MAHDSSALDTSGRCRSILTIEFVDTTVCSANVPTFARWPRSLPSAVWWRKGPSVVVPGLEIGDAVADFAHNARTLVAADGGKHRRQPHRPKDFVGRRHVALEDVVVGVAQPGGRHLDENLAGARRV